MHRTTSRILAGPELCRSEDFINSSLNFSESLFVNGFFLTLIPLGPFRRIGSYIGSFMHRRNLEHARTLIVPVVKQRLAESERPKEDGSVHIDALQWMVEASDSSPGWRTPEGLATQLLHGMWAGSAAPGSLLTQLVFQILLMPEYFPPLRAEAAEAISMHGYTESAIANMPLLDSFMRELNRLYPASVGKSLRHLHHRASS